MNFGSISTSGIQLFTSTSTPTPTLISTKSPNLKNKNRNLASANNKLKTLLDLAELSKWKGAGLHVQRNNQNNNNSTPIICPSKKNKDHSIYDYPQEILKNNLQYGSIEDININQSYTSQKTKCMIGSVGNNNDSLVLPLSNKSRVPDIQMINKYYGLIPKKFTVHSRHSADQNQRSSKLGTNYNRSKSAITASANSRRKFGSSRSLDEDTEGSNEPVVKVQVKFRRGSSLDLMKVCDESKEVGGGGIDKNSNIGLVTKKISPEKQKKWKSAHYRSSSLSSMDDSDRNCHASSKSSQSKSLLESNTDAQRVIKIDLNNMSWEESYQSCYSPSEELQSTRESSPIPNFTQEKTYQNNRTDMINPIHFGKQSSTSPSSSGNNSVNSSCTTSVDLDNGPPLSLAIDRAKNNCKTTHAQTHYESYEKESFVVSSGPSGSTPPAQNISISTISTIMAPNGFQMNYNNSLKDSVDPETSNCIVVTNESSMYSNTSSTESRRARMRKTISFDEQILRPKEGIHSSNKPEPDVQKLRRPSTANFRQPSTAQPTSKVLPWTQKAGKNLTLVERRSKFQKSISIQSTDSIDYGDGEASDFESESILSTKVNSPSTFTLPSPNSSAYRNSRKPLFFQPPAEVSTMISQISPIDNLEIQCEIEKVAIVLKNMQNQNKSFIDLTPSAVSLDDGQTTTNKEERISKQKLCENDIPKDISDINGNPTGNTNNIIGNYNATFSAPNNTNTCSSDQFQSNSNIILNGTSGNFICQPPTEKIAGPYGSNNSLIAIDDPLSMKALKTNIRMVLDKPQFPNVEGLPQNTLIVDNGGRTTTNQTKINSNCDIIKVEENQRVSIPGNSSSNKLPISPPVSSARPPLKKSISISCEKELYKTHGDHHQNEVNGNGSSKIDKNKSARPKTAVILPSKTFSKTFSINNISQSSTIITQSQRARSLNSKVFHQNIPNNRNQSPSRDCGGSSVPTLRTNSKENEKISSTIGSNSFSGESNKSQALRNRKILIKKALIEINQSSAANFGKKWGILGRPKTAPSAKNDNNITKSTTSVDRNKKSVMMISSLGSTNQKRQPLKTSQPPIGLKPGHSVGKLATLGNKIDRKGEPGESNVQEEETMNKETSSEIVDYNTNRKRLHRQSFSLDEGLLLGFSNKEFGWNSGDKEVEPLPNKSEALFENSKKREQCLKIYEKMLKSSLPVKLDTIFRGMMTPSEYRVFIKAAENAARAAAEAAEDAAEDAANTIEEVGKPNEESNEIDAGVSPCGSVTTSSALAGKVLTD